MNRDCVRILDENVYWGRPRDVVNGTGVLVLAGSSGRVDTARVDMLCSRGVTALGLRWFGGAGLPDVPLEVPLEYFTLAVDLLARECDRIVLMGLSYGAEAALLTARGLGSGQHTANLEGGLDQTCCIPPLGCVRRTRLRRGGRQRVLVCVRDSEAERQERFHSIGGKPPRLGPCLLLRAVEGEE